MPISKLNRILAFSLATFLLITAVMLFFEADTKGFPDGHLTALDRAERPLFYLASILSVLFALVLLYLLRSKKYTNTNKIFYRTLIILFLLALVLAVLEWHFVQTLENGMGG